MTKRDYRDYLQDILEALKDPGDFARGMSFEDFAGGKKTINTAVRSVEIIGEATKNLPISLRNRHPTVPWKQEEGAS